MQRLLRRAGIACLAAAMLPTLLAAEAFGSFHATPSASQQVSSSTMPTPTSLATAPACHLLSGANVVLTWTPTAAAFNYGLFVDGYEIWRTASGGGSGTETKLVSVTGASTGTYNDTTVQASPVIGTARVYLYEVRAIKSSWTGAFSTEASATMPSLCL